MTVLKAEGLIKKFGGLTAVDNVSLEIRGGEYVAVIGPNGSGKTTLLNLISGLYRPDKGRIYLDGRDITRVPAHARARLGIARAFQVPRPFPQLTVVENAAVGAMFGAGLSREEALRRAEEAVEVVGLKAKRDVPAARLTFNEMRLLELARALALGPKVLLLDEVMAGLNPGEIERMAGLIAGIAEEKNIAALALVEHRMKAVLKLAHRVVVMNQGRIIAEGAPDQVFNNPLVIEVYLGKSWR
ncbi:MAG: ABC transporter ATP-binding protein [Thermoproteus sp.]|nr:ABC transporter ATP-binding protein [Thermoproteus sp.]